MRKYFHVELTSRCTLACPKCPRTIHNDGSLYKVGDLNFEEFKNFFNPDVLANHQGYYFVFCGYFGDPLYHPDLFKFIEYLRENNIAVTIITNGSGRSEKWWRQLADLLAEDDEIKFSVDGIEDTNHIYRVNSNWQQIYTGMKIMAESRARVKWKYIVFSHNEHQIEEAQQIAKDLGIQFQIQKSDRWTKDDPMKPSAKYVHERDRSEIMRNIDNIDFSKWEMKPICGNGDGLYIGADGYFYPCCWSIKGSPGPDLNINENFGKIIEKYHISEYSYYEILDNQYWKDVQADTKNIETACKKCKINCSIKKPE